MDKFLKELREQRDRIKAHLDWLEQKIESLENPREDGPLQNTSQPEAPRPPKEQTAPQDDASHQLNPRTPDKAAEKEAPVFVPTAYASSTGSDIRKLQIGCSIIFFLATALFIFLLFGLPKLLEKNDDSSSSAEVEAAEETIEPDKTTY
ncbi:MAG: hypothetical protein AAF546_08060 [Verrucomicrobiota bacterium]